MAERDDCGFRPVLLSTGMADVGLVTELNRDAAASTYGMADVHEVMADVGLLTESIPSVRVEHAGPADAAVANAVDAAAAPPAGPSTTTSVADSPTPAATGSDCACRPGGEGVVTCPSELAAERSSSATDTADVDATADADAANVNVTAADATVVPPPDPLSATTLQAGDCSSGDCSSSLSTTISHAGDWSSGLSFEARAAPATAALAPPATPPLELPQGRVRQLTAPPQPLYEAAPGSSHELGLRQESLLTLDVGSGIAEGAANRPEQPSAASSSSPLAISPGAAPSPSPSPSTKDSDAWLAARASLRPPLSRDNSYSPHPRLLQRGSSLSASGELVLASTSPQPRLLSRGNSRPAVELGDFDEAEEAALLRHTNQTLAGDKDVPLPPEGLHARPEAFYEAASHGVLLAKLVINPNPNSKPNPNHNPNPNQVCSSPSS